MKMRKMLLIIKNVADDDNDNFEWKIEKNCLQENIHEGCFLFMRACGLNGRTEHDGQ